MSDVIVNYPDWLTRVIKIKDHSFTIGKISQKGVSRYQSFVLKANKDEEVKEESFINMMTEIIAWSVKDFSGPAFKTLSREKWEKEKVKEWIILKPEFTKEGRLTQECVESLIKIGGDNLAAACASLMQDLGREEILDFEGNPVKEVTFLE